MPEDQIGMPTPAPDTIETVGTDADIAQHNLDQAATWMQEEAKWLAIYKDESQDNELRKSAKIRLDAIRGERLAQESVATPQDIQDKLREDIKFVASRIVDGTIVPKPGQQSMPQDEFNSLERFVENHADGIGPRVDVQTAMQEQTNNGSNNPK